MTGILMCAAGLPVCLTRAPKPILHPPPINKSDMKPVSGINGMRRKTKKKHLRRGKMEAITAGLREGRGGGNNRNRPTSDSQQASSVLPSITKRLYQLILDL